MLASKARPGTAHRLCAEIHNSLISWGSHAITIDAVHIAKNASSREIFDVVDALTDVINQHPASTEDAWNLLTSAFLDWYETESKKSSRRVSRDSSPAKTVRFDIPEPLGSTHTNAELLDQIEILKAERDTAIHDKLAWRQKDFEGAARRADLEEKYLALTEQWKASREELAAERTKSTSLQQQVFKQEAEIVELRHENLRDRSFAEQEDRHLTSARIFLDRLGYQEAPRGYSWIPKDSPVSSPEPPLSAEEALVRTLIRKLPEAGQ